MLYNFGDSVQRYLEHTGQGHLWKSGPTPKPYWDFYKDWNWTGAEFVDLCNAGVDAGFIFTGPARENATEAFNRVIDAGHEVIVITDRQFGSTPSVSHRNTENWLREHGMIPHELVFSADKTCVPTDMFVEDKLENYDALLHAGVDAYLINRAWNHVDGGDARNRINDVMEYANAVEQATHNRFLQMSFA